MAEVTLLPNEGQTQPSYSTQQSSLIGQFDISTTLNSNSYIEFYVLNAPTELVDLTVLLERLR